MLTLTQVGYLKRMLKALKKESKNFKSARRREVINQGMHTVNFILAYDNKKRKHPTAKVSVRARVEKIVERSSAIEQQDILNRLRSQVSRYAETPNFSAYFSNVMRRLRSKPPAWMEFRKDFTKWVYWNNKKYPKASDW